MQDEKYILPSPKFNQKITKSNGEIPNFLQKQVKCLSNHKLFSVENKPKGQAQGFSKFPKQWKGNKPKQSQNISKDTWCDSCDRGFYSLDDLNQHKQEHKKCGINGCGFIAHPTIVSKHIEQQHANGLFDRIKKLSTPEEIAKWREERKKRYPTKANIELRQKAQEERMKRGERLENPKNRFGKKHDRRQMNNYDGKNQQQHQSKDQESKNTNRGRKHSKNHGHFNKNKNTSFSLKQSNKEKITGDKHKLENNIEKIKTEPVEDDDEECNCKIPRFKGTRDLIDYERPKQKKTIQNVLTSLVGMYGSDDETESENDEESVVSENISNSNNQSTSNRRPSVDKINNLENIEVLNQNKDYRKRSLSDSSQEVLSKKTKTSTKKFFPKSENESSEEKLTIKNEVLNEKTESQNKSINELILQLESSPNKIIGKNSLDSDDEMPEEAPIIKEDLNAYCPKSVTNETPPIASSSFKLKHIKRSTIKDRTKKLLDYSKLKKQRPNTLLEKLLQPDIRHERNVLLQCVRYVVENNFFGTGNNKAL